MGLSLAFSMIITNNVGYEKYISVIQALPSYDFLKISC